MTAKRSNGAEYTAPLTVPLLSAVTMGLIELGGPVSAGATLHFDRACRKPRSGYFGAVSPAVTRWVWPIPLARPGQRRIGRSLSAAERLPPEFDSFDEGDQSIAPGRISRRTAGISTRA